jgi:molybdate transport system substrate-binding protein
MTIRRVLLGLIAGLATYSAVHAAEAPRAEAAAPVTVFAAASLQNAMKDIGAAFTRAGGAPVVFSFAGSSVLARQIEQGAPAEVFVSADPDWMNDVEKHGLVQPGARKDILTNHLALVAPRTSTLHLSIAPWFPLLQALGGGKLAMADVTVPAAIYGKASLETLHVWSQVQGQVARAENVRGALNFVARGEAPLGIVYDTDAMVEPGVKIIGLFPDDSHPPILYPAALLKGATPAAEAFLRFAEGPEGKAIFEKYGFRRLP